MFGFIISGSTLSDESGEFGAHVEVALKRGLILLQPFRTS
jgi:hypothetical protein